MTSRQSKHKKRPDCLAARLYRYAQQGTKVNMSFLERNYKMPRRTLGRYINIFESEATWEDYKKDKNSDSKIDERLYNEIHNYYNTGSREAFLRVSFMLGAHRCEHCDQ